jgi:hypothetical protein
VKLFCKKNLKFCRYGREQWTHLALLAWNAGGALISFFQQQQQNSEMKFFQILPTQFRDEVVSKIISKFQEPILRS